MPSSTIANIKAVNSAFGFSFPKERASPDVKTCKDVHEINLAKSMFYVPLLKSVMFVQALGKVKENGGLKNASADNRAFFARAVIGNVLGTVVLLVIDIVFTILIKPFLNLAIWLHDKNEAKKKEIAANQLREKFNNNYADNNANNLESTKLNNREKINNDIDFSVNNYNPDLKYL